MIKLNGNNADYTDISIGNLLKNENYGNKRVAVEVNGEIVPKSKYDITILSDGDSIEVVSFVGGG